MTQLLLLKTSFDMNDADYIYGVKIWDKEEFKKYKEKAMKEEELGLFRHDCDKDWSPEKIFNEYIEIKEITKEQAQVLTELGLADFGDTYLPNEDDMLYEEEE